MSSPNVSMTAIKLEQNTNLTPSSMVNIISNNNSGTKPISSLSTTPLAPVSVALTDKSSQSAVSATTSSIPTSVPSSTLSKPLQQPVMPSSTNTSTTSAVPVVVPVTSSVPVSTLPHIQPQQGQAQTKQSKSSRQRPQQASPRYRHPSASPAAATQRTTITTTNTNTSTNTTGTGTGTSAVNNVRRQPPVAHPIPNIKHSQQPLSHPPSTSSSSSSSSSKSSKKKKTTVTMATTQTATPASTQGENTGRWTAEEHRLFLQGLDQHGKGWKKIASLIKSRTVVQIRTHAQKYFQKLAKARQNGDDGDVSMENRERASISSSTKRRRGGTKRKAIASVVASAEREGKRRASVNAAAAPNVVSNDAAVADPSSQGQQLHQSHHPHSHQQQTAAATNRTESSSTPPPTISNPHNLVPLPTVAPALAPFVYAPLSAPPSIGSAPAVNNGTSAHSQSQPQPQYNHHNHNHIQQQQPSSTTNSNNHHNNNTHNGTSTGVSVPSITTVHGTISGAALEDSLFRFLTPAPNEPMNMENSTQTNTSTQVNDIARQAGANPITLPSSSMSMDKNNTNNIPSQVGGDVSPTGVADFHGFPTNWVWQSGEPPSWYTKGADVDELLNEAEALDWLADSGDLTEEYNPPPEEAAHHGTFAMGGNDSASSKLSEPSLLSLSAETCNHLKPDNINTIKDNNNNNNVCPTQQRTIMHPGAVMAPSVPTLENTVTNNKGGPAPDHNKGISPTPSAPYIPPLPSLFESSNDLNTMKKSSTKPSLTNLSSVSLFTSASEAADGVSTSDLLLDTQFDEQAFVTALLDQDSNNNLLSH